MSQPHNEAESKVVQELARRAQAGEQIAFRELVERTHGPIYRVAFRMLRSSAEAEEIVQETYVRAWQRIASLREIEAVFGWLHTIARNLARDRLRWRLRRREDSLEDSDAERVSQSAMTRPLSERPDALISRGERARFIERAVNSLPDKLRVVILLREVDDMSYEEIALALDIPTGTVESRLHRARKALLQYFTTHQRETGGLLYEEL